MNTLRVFLPVAALTAVGLVLAGCGSSSPSSPSSTTTSSAPSPSPVVGGNNAAGCPSDVVAWATNTGAADMSSVSTQIAVVTGDIANGEDVPGSDNLPQESTTMATAVSQALADPPMPSDAGAAATDYSNALKMLQSADSAVSSTNESTAISDYTSAATTLNAAYSAAPSGCELINPNQPS